MQSALYTWTCEVTHILNLEAVFVQVQAFRHSLSLKFHPTHLAFGMQIYIYIYENAFFVWYKARFEKKKKGPDPIPALKSL